MRGMLAFVKKEMMESVRSYRLLIMLLLFVFLGILNVATAKYTPQLIGALMPEMSGFFPEPSVTDAWVQFFKNTTQLGLIAVVILFSGILSRELSSGTLVLMLTKGLSRSAVIVAKYLVAVLLWGVSYWLSFGVTALYVSVYWPPADLPMLLLAVTGPFVFGCLLIGLLVLGGVLLKTTIGTLLFTAGGVVLMMVMGIIPALARFNPFTIVSASLDIASGALSTADFTPALWCTAGYSVLAVILSVLIFNKRKIV